MHETAKRRASIIRGELEDSDNIRKILKHMSNVISKNVNECFSVLKEKGINLDSYRKFTKNLIKFARKLIKDDLANLKIIERDLRIDKSKETDLKLSGLIEEEIEVDSKLMEESKTALGALNYCLNYLSRVKFKEKDIVIRDARIINITYNLFVHILGIVKEQFSQIDAKIRELDEELAQLMGRAA